MTMTQSDNRRGVSFYECLMACARRPELVSEFNRLTGRHVGEKLARSPLEAMIDEATGYEQCLAAQCDDDLRAFIEFCHDVVWLTFNPQAA